MQQTPAAGPTVGDTVWVTRAVSVPAGYAVRPNGWTLTGAVELLGQPTVERVGDSTMVRYPLVAWDPGPHTVSVPGPILIAPGGAEDTLPAQSMTLVIHSVLPPGVPDSAIQIQPGAGVVLRGEATPWPLAIGLLVVTVLVLAMRWWRSRPGRILALPEVAPPVGPLPYEAWHLSGEDRALVAGSSQALRERIGELCGVAGPELPVEQLMATLNHERPKWPLTDIQQLLRDLDIARFAASGDDALALAHRATEIQTRLSGPG